MIEADLSFSVVAEDDGWIVVNKAAPLIVHPVNNRGEETTLLDGLRELLRYDITCGSTLSIINRLDRETSGLVLVAKNKSMARSFCGAMEQRKITKVYNAIVFGWPEWEEKRLIAPILRKGEVTDSKIWLKQMVHKDGKYCESYFKVIERRIHCGRKVAMLEVSLNTGRMHQIRVHAAFLGHPLVGDKIYGENEEYLRFIETGIDRLMIDRLIMRRHALHASYMSLEINGKILEWQRGYPDDMKEMWNTTDIIS